MASTNGSIRDCARSISDVAGTMTAGRAPLAALAALLLCLLAAAPAPAAPAWLPRVDVNAPDQAGRSPQVAVDPQGTAIAVWRDGGDASGRIAAAVRPAGGAWQAPFNLSAAGQNTAKVQLAIDPRGNATVVWERSSANKAVLQSAVRPAGGAWQPTVDVVATAADFQFAQPRVAVDSQGNAVMVWESSDGANKIVQGTVRPQGGAWQAPVTLSAAGRDSVSPKLAVDPAGNAVAVWTRYEVAGSFVQSAARAPGGPWQAPVVISTAGQSPYLTEIAIDAQGKAVATWDSVYVGGLRSADRPAGGPWQAPVDVPGGGMDAELAVTPQGDAVVISRSDTIVRSSVRPAGGSWQAAVEMPGKDPSGLGGAASAPDVAIDPQGKAVAVWQRVVFTGSALATTVQSAVRLPGGTWQSPPTHLSPTGTDGFDPRVAIDPQGNAVAIWTIGGFPDRVQAAGYDAVAPQLRSLSVPAAGVAGQPVSFSVSPFDVWSAGATTWSFGDAKTATGTAVSHTYAKAGTFNVGVSAADAVANTTSAARTIAIAAGAPTVTRLRVSPAAFRAARTGATVRAATVRSGTRVSYALSLAAKVRFTLQRAGLGRKVGARCVASSRSNRRRPACTRYVTVRGSFTRTRRAGGDRFTFTGRFAGRTLRVGRYRIVVVATAGGRAGRAARAAFRIAR